MSDVIRIMTDAAFGPGKPGDSYEESMRAALRAALDAGWKLVPVEPTDDQIGAAGRVCDDNGHVLMKSGYRAMLCAAPNPLKDYCR